MDKYLQYDFQDFTQEPAFIVWVREGCPTDGYWGEWISKHPHKKQDVERAIAIVQKISFAEPSVDKNIEDKVWSKIKADVNPQSTSSTKSTALDKSKRGLLIRLLPYAAVAAVGVFLVMFSLKPKYDTNIITQFADLQTIELPDGSVVSMNSDSELAYNKGKWESERSLNLTGEAFFSVKKGSRFRVETPTGTVEVLGTSFNIYAREKTLEVFCKTGKVSVSSPNTKTILIPNQSVVVTGLKHEFKPDIEEEKTHLTWRKGLYNFDGIQLGHVISELERQFDIRISIPESIDKELFTGSFKTENLNTALSEVFWPLDLKYDINGQSIIVTK